MSVSDFTSNKFVIVIFAICIANVIVFKNGILDIFRKKTSRRIAYFPMEISHHITNR